MKWCTGLSISLIDNDGRVAGLGCLARLAAWPHRRLWLAHSTGTRQLEACSNHLCWMRECLFPRPLKCPCQGSILWNQCDEVRECLKESCKMLVVTTSEQLRSPDFKLRGPSATMKRMLVYWTKLLLLLFKPSEFSVLLQTQWHLVLVRWKKLLVAQLCLTLCNPVDCSLPGFSVHGVPQAIILEMIAILFSRISSTQGSNLGLLHCRQILYLWATRDGRTIKQRGWVAYLSLHSQLVTEVGEVNEKLTRQSRA